MHVERCFSKSKTLPPRQQKLHTWTLIQNLNKTSSYAFKTKYTSIILDNSHKQCQRTLIFKPTIHWNFLVD